MVYWLRRLGFVAAGVLVILVIVAVLNRERLERLYRVNTLFDEDVIVGNFSSMDSVFPTVALPRSGPVFEFGAAPRPLPGRFLGPRGLMGTEAFLKDSATTSLLVIRDDQIEYEEYFLGTGEGDLRVSWSVAKSFLSALLGVALAEGAIDSLDDRVEIYAPRLIGSAYEGATIRDVAHMASGVAFDEEYLAYDSDINRMGRTLALGGSLDEFAAELTARAGPPGETWRYNSIDTHVLGMVIRGATGRGVADYMTEKIWSRIGAEADGYYLTDGHGAAFVLGGLNMRTRDFARFGRLMLNDGRWGDEQVIPVDWTRESTADSAPPPEPGARFGQGYGYQWWLPAQPDEEFYGIGIYEQYLYIDRKARVVIVKTSADRGFRDNDSARQGETVALFRAIARR